MSLLISGIAKGFGSTSVLRNISLQVPAGSRLAIVGASGCGKSTLLRVIAGFTQPDAGRVDLAGRTLTGDGRPVPAHRRGIGYVAQDGALFPHLTVAANIGFGLPRNERPDRVRDMMELTALPPALAHRYPHQISGGQQQRVALARALAARPGVILLDEPFSALDSGLRQQTRDAVVSALDRSGTTTILVTHDQDEALSFGQGLSVMIHGELAQTGAPAEVFDNPATAQIALFLGRAILLPARLHAGAVVCALGTIALRHDRSGGGQSVLAMVRPSQISLHSNSDDPDATLLGVRRVGALTEVSLQAGSRDPVVITVNIAAHQVEDLHPGSRVGVRITGGVVAYSASEPDPDLEYPGI